MGRSSVKDSSSSGLKHRKKTFFNNIWMKCPSQWYKLLGLPWIRYRGEGTPLICDLPLLTDILKPICHLLISGFQQNGIILVYSLVQFLLKSCGCLETAWSYMKLFPYIAPVLYALLCKKKKMDNFMCLLEFECAKRLWAYSQAIASCAAANWLRDLTLPICRSGGSNSSFKLYVYTCSVVPMFTIGATRQLYLTPQTWRKRVGHRIALKYL